MRGADINNLLIDLLKRGGAVAYSRDALSGWSAGSSGFQTLA
jgi:hypothetical protein